MHETAEQGMREMIAKHVPRGEWRMCVDIGSYNVNGSMKPMIHAHGYHYTGVDIRSGPGVDLVMDDAYTLPIDNGAASLVVSCSCLEHCINPWRLMQDVYRIMEPGAMFVACAPFNWHYHAHPNDYYRYSHEGLEALCTEVGLDVVEVYMDEPKPGGRQDAFVTARKVT